MEVQEQIPPLWRYPHTDLSNTARVFNRSKCFMFYVKTDFYIGEREGRNITSFAHAESEQRYLAQLFHDFIMRCIQVDPSEETRLKAFLTNTTDDYGHDDHTNYIAFLANRFKVTARSNQEGVDIEDDPFDGEHGNDAEDDSGYGDDDLSIRMIMREKGDQTTFSTDVSVDRCSIVCSQALKLKQMRRYRHVQNLQLLRYWTPAMRPQHSRIRHLGSLQSNWRNANLMSAKLRSCQDPEFDFIESLFPQYPCGIHIYFYLLVLAGIQEFSELIEFEEDRRESKGFRIVQSHSD